MPELHCTGDTTHPLRRVDRILEVPNTYDAHGAAFQLTLNCGHVAVVTGSLIVNLTGVYCRRCAEDAAEAS